jgi:hypothetical protein
MTADIRPEDSVQVVFPQTRSCIRFSRGGSHLTIPLRRPHILPVYVRQILAMTAAGDEAPEQEGETNDDPDA